MAAGVVLEQQIDGAWQPLAFFSQQFRKLERKYSTFDRELLAIYLSIRHFRYYLEGRAFTIFTDHKPLTFAMAKHLIRGQTDNKGNFLIFRNFQLTFDMSRGKKIW